MAISFILLIVLSFLSLTSPPGIHARETWFTYDVAIANDSLATLTAEVNLAAPPEIVYAVLTDYPNWPTLFAQRPRLNSIERNNTHVRVDMTLTVSFLPVGLTLITDTREIPATNVVTTLVQGNFEEYDWVWALRPSQDAQHTKATVVVHVQPTIWIPDLVLEWLLTSGLTDHFHRLRDAVQLRYREYGRTPIISAPSNPP